MEAATTHLLAALYALAHGLALTGEDGAEVERHGDGLRPELWRETKRLLREADRGPDGTTLDLGFLPLVLRWLGVASEDAFAAEFGVGAAEAIARDRGRLDEIAGALESPGAPGSEELGLQLTVAWTRRGMVLMQARPQEGSAAVEALERAVGHYPWEDDAQYRQLLESLGLACEAGGDSARQRIVHRQIQAFDREAESAAELGDAYGTAALVISVLWCTTHDDLLLDAERGIEPWIKASPVVWARVRASVEAGDLEGVPIPLATYVAWTGDDSMDSEQLRRALDASAWLLPEMLDYVERLWGQLASGRLPSVPAAHHVQAAARLRRSRLQRMWDPLPAERRNIFYEARQGARRAATLERVELIYRMQGLFLEFSLHEPAAVVAVWLDRAGDAESQGRREEERVALERAVELARDEVHHRVAREHAQICFASWLWRRGEPDEARGRLLPLEVPQATELRAQIEAREPQRAALRAAEELSARRGDVESACAVALAQGRAGHRARGEQLARALCREHPEAPMAWMTLARLLFEHGRYRDAVEPAVRASLRAVAETGVGGGPGSVLLARIFARIGSDGRARGGAIALAAIEAHPTQALLAPDELADLVRIAEDGGAPIGSCRRGDDFVSGADTGGEAPGEWLGQATARRWHGLPAPDAPAWLARLAETGRAAPAELARFMVERCEALQYWRLLVGRSLFGSLDLEAERGLFRRAQALAEGVHELCIAAEVAKGAGRAGASLGWVGASSGEEVERAVHWDPHLEAIARTFGLIGAVRLHASEVAQAMFFAPEEEVPERERLVVLATLEAERFFWARWLAAQESLHDLAVGLPDGCSVVTHARLQPILELAADGSFDAVSSAAWATRWHDAERR